VLRSAGVAANSAEFPHTIQITNEHAQSRACFLLSQWRLSDFYYAPESRTLVLEAHAGGRVYEKSDNGFELLWGTILAVDPGVSLNWCASFSPPYCGPATSYVHLKFEDNEQGGTTFTMTQHDIGIASEKSKGDLEEGWKMIFEGCLKPFAEGA